jgi:hypothetical protein
MSVPSRMSVRPFPKALEPRIRIAYSAAWEGVVTTHSAQALEFIQEFASRIPPLEALNLYFRVVAVPEPMQESVRTRALVELDLDCLPPRHQVSTLSGWRLLRLDLLIRMIRHKRDYLETTLQLARMVGSRAAEAVTATHVSHAIEFARLLDGWVPVERALNHYVFVFALPHAAALAVLQRAQAALVGKQLANAYRDAATLPDWEAEASAPLMGEDLPDQRVILP